MRAWLNGEETTQLSLYDRGLQYGDGVFETMRLSSGSITNWAAHLARLQMGCQRLKIKLGEAELLKQMQMVLSQVSSGVLKLIVTRGEGERGYKINASKHATVIWMYSVMTEYPEDFYVSGVDIHLCKTRISRNPSLAGIKHLNRLENVLARQEWQDEYQEGLMCDEFGNIIEGTMSNFFVFKKNTLITPDLSQCGVLGIMRQYILDGAREYGINTEVRNITTTELVEIDAAMISNSLIGVWPVRSIGGREYAINSQCRQMVERIRAGKNN